MQYASIYTVHESVKWLSDKNNQGIMSIAQLNTGVWQNLQMRVASNIINSLDNTAYKTITGRINRLTGYDSVDKIKDLILPLMKTATLLPNADGIKAKALPDDFWMRCEDGGLLVDGVPATIKSKSEVAKALRTHDGQPTPLYPMATFELDPVRSSGLPASIVIYPISGPGTASWPLTSTLTYWKIPQGRTLAGDATAQTPVYGATTGSDGVEAFNPTTSVNFDLNKAAEVLLIDEFLAMNGINLREEELVRYAEGEKMKEIQRTA